MLQFFCQVLLLGEQLPLLQQRLKFFLHSFLSYCCSLEDCVVSGGLGPGIHTLSYKHKHIQRVPVACWSAKLTKTRSLWGSKKYCFKAETDKERNQVFSSRRCTHVGSSAQPIYPPPHTHTSAKSNLTDEEVSLDSAY